MFSYTKIEIQKYEDFIQPFKIELRLIPEISKSYVIDIELSKETA